MHNMGNLYSHQGTPISEPQKIDNYNLQSFPPPPPTPSTSPLNEIDRVQQMKIIQREGLELFKKKNTDYGDAFANYGAIGVLVRMGDKISRCQSISNNSISLVNTESLRDTLIDLHNYSAMAIMLIDEGNKNKVKLQRQATTTSEIVREVMAGKKVELE
jgi:hypothetical protein